MLISTDKHSANNSLEYHRLGEPSPYSVFSTRSPPGPQACTAYHCVNLVKSWCWMCLVSAYPRDCHAQNQGYRYLIWGISGFGLEKTLFCRVYPGANGIISRCIQGCARYPVSVLGHLLPCLLSFPPRKSTGIYPR